MPAAIFYITVLQILHFKPGLGEVRLDPLQRTPCRGGHCTLDVQQRRQLRQRPGGDDQRPIKDRIDSLPRALENQ